MSEFNINTDECIICLQDISSNSIFLKMPISTSTCECKYIVHLECLRKNNFKCPICSKDIKDKIKLDEIIGFNKKFLCKKNLIIKKNCYPIKCSQRVIRLNVFFYIIGVVILITCLTFTLKYKNNESTLEQPNNLSYLIN